MVTWEFNQLIEIISDWTNNFGIFLHEGATNDIQWRQDFSSLINWSTIQIHIEIQAIEMPIFQSHSIHCPTQTIKGWNKIERSWKKQHVQPIRTGEFKFEKNINKKWMKGIFVYLHSFNLIYTRLSIRNSSSSNGTANSIIVVSLTLTQLREKQIWN